MIARDLLELDDEQFEARIAAVKRRMPQPPGARLRPYEPDFVDTVATAPMPLMPAHAASEIHEDDRMRRGEGAGVFVWPLAVVIVAALASFAVWMAK